MTRGTLSTLIASGWASLMAATIATQPAEAGQYAPAQAAYSKELYSQWAKTSQYVSVRDGTRLALDLYRPSVGGVPVDESLPVVLIATPYLRSSAALPGPQTSVEEAPPETEWLERILKHGYVIAVLDMRGHGASFGSVYGAGLWTGGDTKRWDLYDVIEWLGVQPWSTGKIGMTGCSYNGLTQFWAADAMPPHLKAIVPCGGSYFDEYSILRNNGIAQVTALAGMDQKIWYANDVLHPSPPVDEDKDGALRAAAILEHRISWDQGLAGLETGYPVRLYRNSLLRNSNPNSLPDLAGEWNYLPNYRMSKIPVFQYNGWRDILIDYAFKWYRSLAVQGVPQRMVIGPWWHCQFYKSPLTDVAAEHLRWYDYWLKGIDNGIKDEPPIRYYLTGAPKGQEWRSARQWPLPNQKRTTYFLGAKTLTTLKSSASYGTDNYTVNYTTSTQSLPTRWHPSVGDANSFPIRTSALDAKSLTYTTPPLREDTELTGYPVATLWISSTAQDQDVFVYLEEVDQQGTSSLISDGLIRASSRATRPAPFENEGLPWRSGLMEDQQLLTPGMPVRLEFALFPAAQYLRKGHRLRLTINNYDEGYDTPKTLPAPIVSLYHDADHPSSITVPFIAVRGRGVNGRSSR
jgi:uncharacterized protein